ncbi:MAG: Fur family transcriptional regulator [Chloroflexota bacterium]
MDETHPHTDAHHEHFHAPSSIDLGEHLRGMGYRLTPQRRLIMDIILESPAALTAQSIYHSAQAHSDRVDQATVYRTLELFQKIGLIYASQKNGQAVYERAAHVPHHHLVCRKCGRIEHLSDHHFQQLIDHLWKEHRFRADINHLTLNGLCEHCLE